MVGCLVLILMASQTLRLNWSSCLAIKHIHIVLIDDMTMITTTLLLVGSERYCTFEYVNNDMGRGGSVVRACD